MSQRAVLRGFLLCLTTFFAAGAAYAQSQPGIAIIPSLVQVPQGGQSAAALARLTFSFAPTGGPVSGTIDFGLPRGLTTVPATVSYTIPAGATSVDVPFRIAAPAGFPTGLYSEISVYASPYQLFGYMEVEVVESTPIEPRGALSAAVSNRSMVLCAGGDAAPNSVTVTPLNGYRGSPTVTFGSVPAGVEITPSPIRVPSLPPIQSVEFQVRATSSASPGVHAIQVLVKDPIGAAASTEFTLEVLQSDFAPSVTPATIVLGAGGAVVPVGASILPGSCPPPSSVTVAPAALPAGVTVTPASAVLTAPDFTPVTFSFTAAAGTPVSSGSLAMTFTPDAGPARTANVPYSIRLLGSLAASLSKASVELCPGSGFVQNVLTVSPVDGYEGSPAVSFPGLPAGLVVSQASIPVPPLPPARTVSFGIAAEPGTTPGPRTVTVVVTDPLGPTATATFTAVVKPPDFFPAISPASVPLEAGGGPASFMILVVPGDCPPTTPITVEPAALPPGITVTPPNATLVPPSYAAVSFSVQAAPGTAPGEAAIALTFAAAGAPSKTRSVEIVVCGPPPAPSAPAIAPSGNAAGPVTATDFLTLTWGAPDYLFPATRYEYRVNGEPWKALAGTEASAPPRGKVDPVQLFVRAYACAPEAGPGAEASSPVYPLAPPVANFAVPASITVGSPVTFTDTSSPQATSWLWFPGDGIPATNVQSPAVTYTSAGPKVVVLVATNGSGSSTKTATVNVFPPVGLRAGSSSVTRSLDRQPDGRLALDGVLVESGTTLSLRRVEGAGETVAFLRLLDADGALVAERRLVVAEGEEARHALSAWAAGTFRVEVVGPAGLEAAVEERAVPLGAGDVPVTPRKPAGR